MQHSPAIYWARNVINFTLATQYIAYRGNILILINIVKSVWPIAKNLHDTLNIILYFIAHFWKTI